MDNHSLKIILLNLSNEISSFLENTPLETKEQLDTIIDPFLINIKLQMLRVRMNRISEGDILLDELTGNKYSDKTNIIEKLDDKPEEEMDPQFVLRVRAIIDQYCDRLLKYIEQKGPIKTNDTLANCWKAFTKKLDSYVATITVIKNKYGNLEMPNTGIVFEHKNGICRAIGIQREGKIDKLTEDAVLLCQYNSWVYVE